MSTSTRHTENPFLDSLVVKKKSKRVTVSALGSKNDVLISESTGEVKGTHVCTYKQVDDAEFVKLFVANIAMTFNLTASGIKSFNVLMFVVQYKAIQKDVVVLDKYSLDDFLEANKAARYFSKKTFDRGLRELEKAQIIAKARKMGFYYINPSFIFNGDRIAFTRIIERNPEQ